MRDRYPEGTYVADVTWASHERFQVIKEEFSCSVAPEVCVEIWSASNSEEEIEMKKRLYLQKAALEFWYCDEHGGLTFSNRDGQLSESEVCPEFPSRIVE